MPSSRKKNPPTRLACRKWPAVALVIVLAITVTVTWLGVRRLSNRSAAAQLPELPQLGDEPAARAEIIRLADAAARAEAMSPDRVGHLGMVYRANLYYARAAQCFDRAAALDQRGWRWRYHAALILEERGEVAASAERLRKVLQIRKDFAPAWFRLGQAEFKLGNVSAAEKAYGKAASLRGPPAPDRADAERPTLPVSAHARYQLARLAFRQSEHQRAVEILEPLLQAHPNFGPARRQLARAYRALGRAEDAAQQTKRAAALPPYVPPLDPLVDELIELSRSSTFLLKQAALANRGGQYGWAEELIRRARKYEPEDLEATFRLAMILQNTGRADRALPHFQKILDIYPARVFALDGVAECLVAIGRRTDAIKYYRRIVELEGDNASHLNNLATALAATNQLGEAEQLFRRAMKIDPELTGAIRNLGRLLAMTGRAEEAIDCYRSILADRQEDYGLRTDLGATLAMSGRLDEAITELNEALRFDPGYPPALSNLLSALIRRRRFAEAIPVAKRLLQLTPRDPKAHFQYAVAAANLGNKADAIRHCRLALAADPTREGVRRLLNQLQQQQESSNPM